MLRTSTLLLLAVSGLIGAERTPLVTEGQTPTYPQLAIQARLSGRVRVVFRVVHGTVTEAHVAQTDDRIFNEPTLNRVRSWRFEQSTSTSLETEFIYAIEKSEGGALQNPVLELRLPVYVRLVATPVRPVPMH